MNKTPISESTNREIGGIAPSQYLTRIERKGQVAPDVLDEYLESHFIDVASCRSDSFDAYFVKRAITILDAIESATGKAVPGRDSEETVQAFGSILRPATTI